MKRHIKQLTPLLLILLLLISFTSKAKLITDQLNRTVEVPDKIDRAVVLQHQTLNLIVQLNN